MAPANESRKPKSGEPLMLADGRRFIVAAVEDGVRGWWFTATAQDGRTTLQANMRLEWDLQARAWRPLGVRTPTARAHRMRWIPQPRQQHPD